MSTPTPFTNSTCRDLDHQWVATTSETYRRCSRLGCHATERFVAGRWLAVAQRRRSAQHTPPIQMPLFALTSTATRR